VFSLRRKIWCIEYKGGQCEDCGLVSDKRTDFALFDFHHCYGEKEFEISSGITVSLKKLKEELDKCALLCANCHRKKHIVAPSDDIYMIAVSKKNPLMDIM
jgi:hypothetical protein